MSRVTFCLFVAAFTLGGQTEPSRLLHAQEGAQGNWSLNQPAAVPLDAPASPRLADNATSSNDSTANAVSGFWTGPKMRPSVEMTTETEPTTQAQARPETTATSPGNQPAGLASRATASSPPNDPFISGLAQGAEALGATRLSGSFVQTALLLGALGLAPAILLMTTCYIRIMVVLGLLRQALGTTQLPPTQILMSLSMFLTILVMTPVWMELKTKAFDPWYRAENPISWEEAWNAGTVPLKQFMVRQIEICGNRSAVDVLYRHGKTGSAALTPPNLEEAPLNVILPAFILSELKVAFLLGFQIFLPFLILDLVVSTVTVSMGLAMLPPTMVSLPLKLILFVLVDGWNLVVGMLLQSFGSV